jgi:putative toxin-antitoxin system antitoxin component (TIGR02293 family)
MSTRAQHKGAPPARGAIRLGLPVSALDRALASGDLTQAELARLALPRKTLAHRRALGTPFPEQSDRFSRALRVIAMPGEIVGDQAIARRWLRRPNAVLQGEAPLDVLDTDIGAFEAETLLLRIGHGIAA